MIHVAEHSEACDTNDLPKISLTMGGSGPRPSNTWLRGPTALHMPNGIWIVPAVFAVYLVVTSQTDRQTTETSVAIGRIYMVRIYDAA